MKASAILFFFVSILVGFSSCRKDPARNLTVSESWVFITSGANGINFSNYKTFTIPDSVVLISNQRGSNNYETNQLAQTIIKEVGDNMIARGFTKVTKSNNPDLGISISRISNTYTSVAAFNGWWDPTWGYWDPGFWGYPGFGWAPTQFVFYNTTESAWAIDLIDLKNTSGNSLRIIWSGNIRGEGIFDSRNVEQLVSALFEQSPYLSTN